MSLPLFTAGTVLLDEATGDIYRAREAQYAVISSDTLTQGFTVNYADGMSSLVRAERVPADCKVIWTPVAEKVAA